VTKRYVTLWGSDLQRLHRERSPIDSLAPLLKVPRSRLRLGKTTYKVTGWQNLPVGKVSAKIRNAVATFTIF
jgi:hypothetical protein